MPEIVKLAENVTLYCGECEDVLPTLDPVSAVVTDPPYGLSFMGKAWDYDIPGADTWAAVLRALRPGGHLLAFAGTRTQHRMASAIEDAGFEIRDLMAWMYGSGFPKSHNISKAIDKAAGVRGHDGTGFNAAGIGRSNGGDKFRSDHPDYVKPSGVSAAAKQWDGWGTALKPSFEPITLARRPFKGPVFKNVVEHGTGGLNIDAARIGEEKTVTVRNGASGRHGRYGEDKRIFSRENKPGRWPANVIHDGSPEVLQCFPEGSARFFYTAKASKAERDRGCENMTEKVAPKLCDTGYGSDKRMDGAPCAKYRNHHPTIKPVDLMRYLVRLVTPPGAVVLDPFMGSGTTGVAAVEQRFGFIGIEREPEYFLIAVARVEKALQQGVLGI